MEKRKKSKKKEMNKKIISIIAITIVLGIILLINLTLKNESFEEIENFRECTDAGYLVSESYPRQCRTSEGKVFVEEITKGEACVSLFNGNWLEEHKECENINQEQCLTMEGEYNECASLCRHLPDNGICIMVCVPVCSFK
jgi:hypothetical protein